MTRVGIIAVVLILTVAAAYVVIGQPFSSPVKEEPNMAVITAILGFLGFLIGGLFRDMHGKTDQPKESDDA